MSKSILSTAVSHIKATGLSGKARDDAADHFLAGARAALAAASSAINVLEVRADDDEVISITSALDAVPVIPDAKGYLAVLEALATAEG